MSLFGKNIRKIRNIKNLSQQSFAELFDLKRGTLGAYEEGRSEPRIETIIKVANYFSITIDDLLTKEITVNKLLKFKDDLSLEEDEKVREVFAEIPCLTENYLQEYPQGFQNEHFISTLPVIQLPLNPEKKYRAYTVNNLEMTDHDQGFYPKDIVIGECVAPRDFTKINNGCIVLVLINEELILRRIYVMKNKLTLRADHKNIDDMQFELNDLKEMWEIKYVFYKRIPEQNTGSNSLEDKLNFLEQEFIKLKNKQ